jgi:hypothetical protein
VHGVGLKQSNLPAPVKALEGPCLNSLWLCWIKVYYNYHLFNDCFSCVLAKRLATGPALKSRLVPWYSYQLFWITLLVLSNLLQWEPAGVRSLCGCLWWQACGLRRSASCHSPLPVGLLDLELENSAAWGVRNMTGMFRRQQAYQITLISINEISTRIY